MLWLSRTGWPCRVVKIGRSSVMKLPPSGACRRRSWCVPDKPRVPEQVARQGGWSENPLRFQECGKALGLTAPVRGEALDAMQHGAPRGRLDVVPAGGGPRLSPPGREGHAGRG